MKHIKILSCVYDQMINTVGETETESGGAMAMQNNTIVDFYFDIEAGCGNKYYKPSSSKITEVARNWEASGFSFGGFLHSHEVPYTKLSAMDIVSAARVIAVNKLPCLFMGVLCGSQLYMYEVSPGDKYPQVTACTYEII